MEANNGMKGVVKTPMGIGRIVARIREDGDGSKPFSPMDNTRYLVVLSRSNFRPEEWKKISPGNGPCIFRAFGFSELE